MDVCVVCLVGLGVHDREWTPLDPAPESRPERLLLESLVDRLLPPLDRDGEDDEPLDRLLLLLDELPLDRLLLLLDELLPLDRLLLLLDELLLPLERPPPPLDDEPPPRPA